MSFVKHILKDYAGDAYQHSGIPQSIDISKWLIGTPKDSSTQQYYNSTKGRPLDTPLPSAPTSPSVDREKPSLRITATVDPSTADQAYTKSLEAVPGAVKEINPEDAKHLHASYDQPRNIVMHLHPDDYTALEKETTPEGVSTLAGNQVIKGVEESGVKIDDTTKKWFLDNVVENSKQWYSAQVQSGITPQTTDYYIYLTQLLNAKQFGITTGYNPDYMQNVKREQLDTIQTVKDNKEAMKTLTPNDPAIFGNNPIVYQGYASWAALRLQSSPNADVSVEQYLKEHPESSLAKAVP